MDTNENFDFDKYVEEQMEAKKTKPLTKEHYTKATKIINKYSSTFKKDYKNAESDEYKCKIMKHYIDVCTKEFLEDEKLSIEDREWVINAYRQMLYYSITE